MAQQPVEMILLKQWAEHMASSVWLMDAEGNLVYYNEPAESILGLRFDEAGEINAAQIADLFPTTAPDGSPVDGDELPIVRALTHNEPSHAELCIRDRIGEWHNIEVTALPLVAASHRKLGAIAIFWEVDR
ncbi:MAG: PAS domain-containing protein [bacterium]|nr:PAS domain-containing protein [bacterium]